MQQHSNTPWRRVFAKFGLSQSAFAQAMGWHRSKICRALADEDGLINGNDQKTIVHVAKERDVVIDPADMVPGI